VFHVVFAVFSARKFCDDVGKFCVFQVVSFYCCNIVRLATSVYPAPAVNYSGV